MLKSRFSLVRDARSRTPRLVAIEYSIDVLTCHSCGGTGYGKSLFGSCRCMTSGTRIGVGLPIISVRIARMLWNAAVLRMPPFHHPSYDPPDREVAPGLPSTASRDC